MSTQITSQMIAFVARLQARLAALRTSDRGDVPGWVMVTLMTAALVAAVFMIAQDRLTTILSDALKSVLP